MSPLADLAARVRKQYAMGGFGSIFSEGINFVTKDAWVEALLQRSYVSRPELRKHCERENRIWYGEDEAPFELPQSSHPHLRREFESFPDRFEPGRSFVCELTDCYLVGRHAIGVSSRGLVGETTPHSPKELSKRIGSHLDSYGSYARLFSFDTERGVQREIERAFPLVDNDRGYYHWITEYLPKVRRLRQYCSETGHRPTVLIKSDAGEYVRQSLEVVGVKPNDIQPWEPGDARVESLVVARHRPHKLDYFDPLKSNYALSRDDIQWLRETIRQSVTSRNNGPDRVYVSRQEADRRRVSNYDEVVAVLERFDIEPYVLEELSFEEQMELFTGADVIVGPHGAGLANMIVSDDPIIVELIPEAITKPHFYNLASILGFDYEPIVVDSSDGKLDVDTSELSDCLNAIAEDALS